MRAGLVRVVDRLDLRVLAAAALVRLRGVGFFPGTGDVVLVGPNGAVRLAGASLIRDQPVFLSVGVCTR